MKVLKIAAIVVTAVFLAPVAVGVAAGASIGAAIGAVATTLAGVVGASVATGLLVAAAAVDLSMIAGALLPKPSVGGSQTKWKADPYAGIPYVMGRTLVGGNIVYRRAHGSNNKFQTFVTILSLGTILSIDAYFFNQTHVTFSDGTHADGTYRDHIWLTSQRGLTPQPAALVPPAGAPAGTPPGWTTAHKLSGLAAVMHTLAYDAQSDEGITSEPAFSAIVKGVLVYDPRQDSTYPGGSGSCRALEESTYVWSEDPHLHALTWCLGRFQNGVRVAGIGAPIAAIDVAAFVEGANLNDARGWKIGGQVYTRPDTPWNSLKAMLQAGGASPILTSGIISCVNRAPRVSLATITRADIVGDCSFSGTQSRRARLNGIIPQYRSEEHDWELVSAAEVSVPAYVELDGDERTKEISYSLVQQVDQASQLAAYDICDSREAGPGTAPLKPKWLNYRIGDCLTFNPEPGWQIKVIVTGRTLDPQAGTVTFTFTGETDAKHAYALGQTGTAPPIVSFSYDTSIPAPVDDWTLEGTTVTANGGSLPALVLTGAVGNATADAVLIESRPYATGLADDEAWVGHGFDATTLTTKQITTLAPATAYQVSVRYRARGLLGQRAIFGPVTTGEAEGFAGPPGTDGLPGRDGTDGSSAYVHVAYADSSDGTTDFTTGAPGARTYIGILTNGIEADSANPADYAWSLIRGANGADGLPGAAGADGVTPYVHFAYANSSDGSTDFNVSDPTGRAWLGVLVDTTVADSTTPSDYAWSLIKGSNGLNGTDGLPGRDGTDGADGTSAYVHFAYANSADGSTDFTIGSPGARTYIGVRTDAAPTDSTTPSDYHWSLIKGADGANGDDGIPGAPGADGVSTYVHVVYSNAADGSVDFSTSDPTGRAYIGVRTDTTFADSTTAADYAWSLIKGADGSSPISASLSATSMTVRANSDGSTKSGELPKTTTIVVLQGGTDISGLATITPTASSASISGSMSSNVYSVSTADDSGYVDFALAIDGVDLPIVPRLSITRQVDAVSGGSSTSDAEELAGQTVTAATYDGTGLMPTLLLKANGSGELTAAGYATYVAVIGTGNATFVGAGKLVYRVAGSGSGYSDAASETAGSSAHHLAGGNDTEGSVSTGSVTISGLTAGALYEIGFNLRKSSGTSGSTAQVTGGSVSVSQ